MKTIKLFLCLIVAFIGMNANAQSVDSQKQKMHKVVDESIINKDYNKAAHDAIDSSKGVNENKIKNAVEREMNKAQKESDQKSYNNGDSSTGYNGNSSPKNDGRGSSTGYSRNSSPKNDGGKKSSPEPKSKDNDCHTPQCEAAKAIENK